MRPVIALLGSRGQVGTELERALSPLGAVHALHRDNGADFTDSVALLATLHRLQPSVVVNAAAYTAVDRAESDAATARQINTDTVAAIAQWAAERRAWLVHYSTDYVFDGAQTQPYTEDTATAPLSVYGVTKRDGERAVRAAQGQHLVLRTSWVYASRGANFAKTMLKLARDRDELRVVNDQYGAPTSAALIADVTALLLYRLRHDSALAAHASGTYHLVADGRVSWFEYAQWLLQQAETKGVPLRVDAGQIQPIASAAYPTPAKRPLNSTLSTQKLRQTFGLELPPWQTHATQLLNTLLHESLYGT